MYRELEPESNRGGASPLLYSLVVGLDKILIASSLEIPIHICPDTGHVTGLAYSLNDRVE